MAETSSVPHRVQIILDEPLTVLDYSIPTDLLPHVAIGYPVRVPLGNRQANGYITEIIHAADSTSPEEFELRPIGFIDDSRPTLPKNLIELILFTAKYYAVTAGDVLHAALPAAARNTKTRFAITEEGQKALLGKLTDGQQKVLEYAQNHQDGFASAGVERAYKWNKRSTTGRLKRLLDKGLLKKVATTNKGPRRVVAYKRVGGARETTVNLTPQSRALLHSIPILEPITAKRLGENHAGIYSKLKTLEKHGLVERSEIALSNNPYDIAVAPDQPLPPTEEQAKAISTLNTQLQSQIFATFLLQGVTGSGKTEVYLQIIEQCLSLNKTALVLVPEIALTPQLGGRFRARFGNLVATFHSGLTPAERRDEWNRVRKGEAKIGLGARSAIFLPLENIGIIIVDEEHETSFKQEETPRYNARDLAVVRSRFENAVCILGSATPSLESRRNAQEGRYEHIKLTKRVLEQPLPPVEIIPLADTERVGEGIFTAPLLKAIEDCVHAKEQAIIFLNRRGFAPYVFCKECGTPFRCPDCDVSLTLHQKRNCLLCHYCAFEMPTPRECPVCESTEVGSSGIGTERIETELKTLLPDVQTIRLDRDTVRRRVDLESRLNDFRDHNADVLIGTQMVAKGHDFPGVTLVGVITADTSLNFPDFRAGERTFQLLTQVAGRAGRSGKASRVLIQAYETTHYAIQCALKHDYEDFVRQETVARKELQYPPYSHLALFRFESEEESLALNGANEVAQRLQQRALDLGNTVAVLGPVPAALARLKGIWRVQILLKSSNRRDLRDVIEAAGGKRRAGIRQILDVDPISML